MSRVLKLDKKFYGEDGLLSLYRGDDWAIYGTVVDRVLGYETLVDLLPYSAVAYFPAATGTTDLPAIAVSGGCGVLAISLPAASTPLAQTNTGGQAIYVVLTDGSGKQQTVTTIDEAVAILDRGFPTA
jgi:hypothetical protein